MVSSGMLARPAAPTHHHQRQARGEERHQRGDTEKRAHHKEGPWGLAARDRVGNTVPRLERGKPRDPAPPSPRKPRASETGTAGNEKNVATRPSPFNGKAEKPFKDQGTAVRTTRGRKAGTKEAFGPMATPQARAGARSDRPAVGCPGKPARNAARAGTVPVRKDRPFLPRPRAADRAADRMGALFAVGRALLG